MVLELCKKITCGFGFFSQKHETIWVGNKILKCVFYLLRLR